MNNDGSDRSIDRPDNSGSCYYVDAVVCRPCPFCSLGARSRRMKIARESAPSIVIGKRIPLGSAITAIGTILASFYPDHAVAIMAASIPLTFFLQVIVVNFFGVTESDT